MKESNASPVVVKPFALVAKVQYRAREYDGEIPAREIREHVDNVIKT